MSEQQPALLNTLAEEIVARAREATYLPEDEIPYIQEIEDHGQQIVLGVCAAISDRMQQGMPHDELVRVFRNVIARTFDAVYRWHVSEDGKVPMTAVAGDPVNDEFRGALPEEVVAELKGLPAAELLYDVLIRWIEKNRGKLEAQQIDLWVPVVTALQMTVLVATAMALRVFT
jgi:hypothetical protein